MANTRDTAADASLSRQTSPHCEVHFYLVKFIEHAAEEAERLSTMT